MGIMAVGMTGLMISGYFDISVGSLLALTAAVAVSLTGYSIPLAIVLTLMCGAFFGAINGLLVTKAKVNAFIVTLAAMVGVRGLVYVYTKEREIIGLAPEFEKLAAGKIFSIPLPIIIWAVILIVAEWALRRTVYGRNAYAIGGDAEAAKNAGVPVDKYVLGLFILNGFLVAVAGLVLASRLNAATPILGIGQEMIVIISVVLGGTKLTGGFGNMIKTVAGVLTIGMIQNGLNILNVHHFYSMLIMGLIFIFVIFMDAKLSTTK
jgi:ribose transport system permease protein